MNQSIASFLPSPLLTFWQKKSNTAQTSRTVNNLFEANVNKEYQIKDVISADKETLNFLFTLGCFKGQSITLLSVLSETYVIAIKDARYSIDADLAKSVILEI
jgi:ferrous iron transport protein A